MIRNTFPISDHSIIPCTTTALVCTSCKHVVQENGAIGLV